MEHIADRLENIRNHIADAARRSGRAPADIELVAVSKKFPAESLLPAVDAGVALFGESRVQEAEQKIPLLPSRLHWHLIGNLQSNKVRRALPLFDVIHSIGSLDLAQTVNRIAGELGLFPKVYLQTNLASESSKHGFSSAELRSSLDALLELDRLHILGLMAIPPFRPEPDDSRADFAALRELRDDLEEHGGAPLPGLSMGMSHDYQVAIEEGATSVRIGTALFGERS